MTGIDAASYNLDDSTAGDDFARLRKRVSDLSDMTLDKLEAIMRGGVPRDQIMVAKSVLPGLIKVIGEQQQVDELAEMRELLRAMQAEMRSNIGGIKPPAIDADSEELAVDGEGDDGG